MVSKSKQLSTASVDAGVKTLTVVVKDGKSRKRHIAELALSPIVGNASTAMDFSKSSWGNLDLADSIAVIGEKVIKVQAGDLSEVEATLTAQAATLDAVFNEMARRAACNMGQHLNATETYLRMALKAQAQCRATLETLAEVRHPKGTTFVRQQNVAYQQQVNNGGAMLAGSGSEELPRAHGNLTKQSNELLEDNDGERVDTSAAGATGKVNRKLAAVVKSDGSENSGRENSGITQRL